MWRVLNNNQSISSIIFDASRTSPVPTPLHPASPRLAPSLSPLAIEFYFHADTKCQIKVSTRKSLFRNKTLWLTWSVRKTCLPKSSCLPSIDYLLTFSPARDFDGTLGSIVVSRWRVKDLIKFDLIKVEATSVIKIALFEKNEFNLATPTQNERSREREEERVSRVDFIFPVESSSAKFFALRDSRDRLIAG